MHSLSQTKSCFGCGRENSLGLNIQLETDGQVARARFFPRDEHAGFKGILHGGLLMTLLDEVMVWACGIQTKRLAYSAEITVRFLRPAFLGQEISGIGQMLSNKRNRLFETEGRLEDPAGEILATATGKYLPMPEDQVRVALTDFEDGGKQLLGDKSV